MNAALRLRSALVCPGAAERAGSRHLMNPQAPAPEVVEQLIRRAEQAGASDIHVQMIGASAQVAFRLDGLMTPALDLPPDLAERVCGRIKYLAKLKTYQDALPQDGRIERADVRANCDLRVATYPTVTGEKIVLRLFHSAQVRTLRELALAPEVCGELEAFLRQTSGLLLLTGPAGSGKTTTIYGCLRFLVELGGRHIITIEDPVEQIVPGVMQTEVNEARGLTCATAARHLLRQDPQVLVLGEIRDEETAGIAVRSALTGHLMIATLHAGSVAGVFERLFAMCLDRAAVITTAALVLNQRLLRRVCAACAGRGCEACLGTGYRGRVPVVEWLKVTDSVRAGLRTHGPVAAEPGVTLARGALALCAAGVTTQAEIHRVLGQ